MDEPKHEEIPAGDLCIRFQDGGWYISTMSEFSPENPDPNMLVPCGCDDSDRAGCLDCAGTGKRPPRSCNWDGLCPVCKKQVHCDWEMTEGERDYDCPECGWRYRVKAATIVEWSFLTSPEQPALEKMLRREGAKP